LSLLCPTVSDIVAASPALRLVITRSLGHQK
jgi:hypothetical protein